MPVAEHGAQLEFDDPGAEEVDHGTSLKAELDGIGEAGSGAFVGEDVAVGPGAKGTFELMIGEERSGLVFAVFGDPADVQGPDRANFKDDAGARLEAAAAFENVDAGFRSGQQLYGVRTFVEGPHDGARSGNHGGVFETRHLRID